jgi:PAS domain S-box-containing protein
MDTGQGKSGDLRKKAERILKQKGIRNQELYNQDLESLVEELSIYQIELEHQNEELKRTRNELEISRNRYTDLFEKAPVGYFIIRENYQILRVNHTGAGMLGMDKSDLAGHNFTRYIQPAYQDTFYFHLRYVLKTGQSQSCEIELKISGKDPIFVAMESIPVREGEDQSSAIRSAILDITKQKHQEKITRESEEKYRTIFDSSGDGFLLMKDRIIDCNEQAARLFGYSKAQLLGKDPVKDLSPEKQPEGQSSLTAGKKYVRKALDGEVQKFYWKHKTKDENYLDTEITLNSIDTAQGRSLIAVVHDISEQVEHQRELRDKNEEIEAQNEEYITLNEELNDANEKLRKTIRQLKTSEEKFKTLYECASDAIYIHDLKGNLIDVNPVACVRLNYSRQELLSLTPRDFSTAEYQELFDERIREIIEKGYGSFETEHISKDGKVIPEEINSRIVEFTDHTAILTISRDITERKKAEQEMLIKNMISNAFISDDHDTFYQDVLEILREHFSCAFGYFGYINDRGDLVCPSMTRNIWNQCQIPDKSIVFPRDSWFGLWGRSLTEHKTFYRNGDLHPPKGHLELTSALVAPILLNDRLIGQFALANKVDGFSRDDKEMINRLAGYIAPLLHSKFQQEAYKENLLKAKEKAEESDRLKSAFLANMSHEIRTPMNGIIGFTQLLKERDVTEKRQERFLDIIDSQSKQLLKIINDIIDISKIEANQLDLEKSIFCLNDLLQELYNNHVAQFERQGINHIKMYLQPGLNRDESFIQSDRARLGQILNNLLTNAIKFTSEGHIAYGYERAENHQLKFFVSDTGIGIPPHKQKEIFERFRQVDESPESARFQGTGLGLSIAKNLVDLLKGEIWLESEEGLGSVFYFTLPFEKGEDHPDAYAGKHEHNVHYRWEDHKVLLVEDDAVSRDYIKEILKDTGIEVVTASNGNEGYRRFKDHGNIDIILMDIRLPDTDGYEVTREIRRTAPDIPIIAQTAYAMRQDRRKCIEAGCTDYVTKPIDGQVLLSIMDQYIN